MLRLRPGWLVALCAAILAVAVWLPWLTTRAGGGGRANAIGGTVGNLVVPAQFGAGQMITLLASTLIVAGAMAGRGLSARSASIAALVISLLLVALTLWYYHINIHPPVSAGYGFYIGIVVAVVAVAFSVWALLSSMTDRRRVS
jgi:hypothetical protein